VQVAGATTGIGTANRHLLPIYLRSVDLTVVYSLSPVALHVHVEARALEIRTPPQLN
jgi:hypothetical protein